MQMETRTIGAKASDDSSDVGGITYKDLEEIRTLKNPPDVVRRTLEVTCLILAAPNRPAKPEPPAWSLVQRKLGDAQFLSQVLSSSPASLRSAPNLITFIATEYFGTENSSAISSMIAAPCACPSRPVRASMKELMSRSASQAQLPVQGRLFRTGGWNIMNVDLTIERVQRASPTAATLLRWCASMLEAASGPDSQGCNDAIPLQCLQGKTGVATSLSLSSSAPIAPLKSTLRQPSESKLSPRALGEVTMKPAIVPVLPLQSLPKAPLSSLISPPSSYRQKKMKAERLQPLLSSSKLSSRQMERIEPTRHSELSPGSSGASASTGMRWASDKANATSLATAPVLIDRAIEKVQSLAFAKISQAQALSARSNGSTRHANGDILPVEAKPSTGSGNQEKKIASAADSVPEPEKEEDNKSHSVNPILEHEDPPWQEFQSTFMKDAALPSAGSKPGDPEKVADKALRKMEKSMRAWEEEMKQAAASNGAIVHDSNNRVLEGGFLEAEVSFSADSVEVVERHEDVLRRVAATVRMRDKLRLQLIGCGIELDGPAITISRVCNVFQFFKDDGIPCHAVHAIRSADRYMPLGMQLRQGRSVLCRLHMNFDMELCGHLLGTLPSTNSKTKNIAAWLKSNFDIITY